MTTGISSTAGSGNGIDNSTVGTVMTTGISSTTGSGNCTDNSTNGGDYNYGNGGGGGNISLTAGTYITTGAISSNGGNGNGIDNSTISVDNDYGYGGFGENPSLTAGTYITTGAVSSISGNNVSSHIFSPPPPPPPPPTPTTNYYCCYDPGDACVICAAPLPTAGYLTLPAAGNGDITANALVPVAIGGRLNISNSPSNNQNAATQSMPTCCVNRFAQTFSFSALTAAFGQETAISVTSALASLFSRSADTRPFFVQGVNEASYNGDVLLTEVNSTPDTIPPKKNLQMTRWWTLEIRSRNKGRVSNETNTFFAPAVVYCGRHGRNLLTSSLSCG